MSSSLLEQIDFISGTTVEGALHGFAFALYIFCARAIHLQLKDRDRRRQNLFTLLYMSLVMALSLCGVAVDARNKQSSYIDHADYPGGSFDYYVDVAEKLPATTMAHSIAILFSIMIYGIQIWRLWIVWNASQYAHFIVVLPILAFLVNIVVQVVDSVMMARSALTDLRLDVAFVYVLTATPLCISVTTTVSIIVRIIMVRREHLRVIGQTDSPNPYTSIISMLIESFALECVWMVAKLSLFDPSKPVVMAACWFFTVTELSIQLLAYLLVVLRVSTKRGWERDTEGRLTTLQWNQNGLQTTQLGAQISVPMTHAGA